MQSLRRELEALETHLASLPADRVDPALRDELRALADRIDTLVGEGEDALEPEAHRDLPDRLSDLALRFETEHPALTETLGSVVRALSRLGI